MITSDEYAVQWSGGSRIEGFTTHEEAENYAKREISFLAGRFGTDIAYELMHREVKATVVYGEWEEL